ncbi:unnamed protein product [Paramecium sonneborni]|uniref:Uncharacterized protein n=1 Tax=Paramecium sonneborni TaxID=65129 RepID=A0A8S1PY39_9CILI|nr:unnamed protein product [Paramecium sonneborni]
MAMKLGPKLKFVMPLQKIISFDENIEGIFDFEQRQQSISKMERKVSFVGSTIVFIRYSEEEIVHFRQRLRSQIQCSIELIDSSYLNPQLCSPDKQSRKKSCFKEQEEQLN